MRDVWRRMLHALRFTAFLPHRIYPVLHEQNVTEWHVGDVQVNVLFLTRAGHPLSELWDAWYARAASDVQKVMKRSNVDDVLRGWGTWRAFNETESDPPVWPKWVTPLVEQPTDARWGAPNRAVHHLLESVLPVTAPWAHYILVSESHVPVKSFLDIYKDIVADPRTRFSAWVLDFPRCSPKTSAWYSLSREHAALLVANPDVWLIDSWYTPTVFHHHRTGPLVGAEDEYFTFDGLFRLLDPIGHKRVSCLKENDFPPDVRMVLQKPPDFRSETFVFWYEAAAETTARYIGGGSGSGVHPLQFHRVETGLLKYLNEQTDVWFMRKIVTDSFVPNCLGDIEPVPEVDVGERDGSDPAAALLHQLMHDRTQHASVENLVYELIEELHFWHLNRAMTALIEGGEDIKDIMGQLSARLLHVAKETLSSKESMPPLVVTTDPYGSIITPWLGAKDSESSAARVVDPVPRVLSSPSVKNVVLLGENDFYKRWIGLNYENRSDPRPFRVGVDGTEDRHIEVKREESPPPYACSAAKYLQALLSTD